MEAGGGVFAARPRKLRAKAEKLAAKAFKNAADGFKLRAELPRSRHRERGCGQRFSNSRQGKTNCGRRFRNRGRRPEKNGSGGSWPAGGRIIARPIARFSGETLTVTNSLMTCVFHFLETASWCQHFSENIFETAVKNRRHSFPSPGLWPPSP